MCRQVGDCGNPYEDSPKIPLNTIKCFQSIFCQKATNKDAVIELIVVGKAFSIILSAALGKGPNML